MFFTIIWTLAVNFSPNGHLIKVMNERRHRKSHLKKKSWKKNTEYHMLQGHWCLCLSFVSSIREYDTLIYEFFIVHFLKVFHAFLARFVSFFQNKRLCKIAIFFKISVGLRPVHFFYNSKRDVGGVSCLSCLYLAKILH